MSESLNLKTPEVYASDLIKLANKVINATDNEKTEISFEFIIASLFPTCWKNIQNEMSRQYTLGYISGQEDCKREMIQNSRVDLDCYCE